jgi:hypothetical protein
VQAVAAPGGFPLWTSGPEPGSVHDITRASFGMLGIRQFLRLRIVPGGP